jgi:probable rRNA maturation factor
LNVDFSVEDGLTATWDEPRITALIASIVGRERSGDADYVIGVYLVGNRAIQQLNAEHLHLNSVTDVLSFPLTQAEAGFVLPEGEPVNLGDVVVSYPRAVAQADEYGHSVEREVAYLVAHGVLHLLGYDHEDDLERERMRHKEEEALQPLGFTR